MPARWMLAVSSIPTRTACLELPVHLEAETQRQKYNNCRHCANPDWIKINRRRLRLGAFGQAGVERALDLLNRELAITMRGSVLP